MKRISSYLVFLWLLCPGWQVLGATAMENASGDCEPKACFVCNCREAERNAAAWPEPERFEKPVRLELNLFDGSRIFGSTDMESAPLHTAFAEIDVPLSAVMTVEFNDNSETAVVRFRSGDRLTGAIALESISLETIFGKVSIDIEHIRNLRVMMPGARLPAGEGPLAFGGVNWKPWRTQFEVRGDKLMTLPKARPGFRYGHGGNGRGATLMTNIGNREWKDYRVEVDFCITGLDPTFNRYNLSSGCGGGWIYFHVADAKESWNERGMSAYELYLNRNGAWSLKSVYNAYCNREVGWVHPIRDGGRVLAQGEGLTLDPENGNRIRIDVVGAHIRIWVDSYEIVNVQDVDMGELIGGTTLDHGGVGFHWLWEYMGWIRNFSAESL